jgi:hypothetical protein
MQKKLALLAFASLLIASGTRAWADVADDDDIVVGKPVPDTGSTAMLLGSAATGLAGIRIYLRKKK